MSPKKLETIIIGAGPAGLTAGRYLEDALILEQKKEIGRPVQCAEGISREALEKQGIKPDPAWISAVVNTAKLIAPSGKGIDIKGDRLGFVIDRAVFEKSLAKMSKAEIKLRTKVTDIEKEDDFWKVKTEGGEVFKSKYLIGADGPLSVVRKKVFGEKLEILPAIEYLVELEKGIDTGAMLMYFDREKLPNGYAWIFPKSKKTANIGLGALDNLNEEFRSFMTEVVERDFGNYKLLENKSGIVPWGGARISLQKDNALLVGDAGGLADPVFGGGMNSAMISGRVAAESILKNKVSSYESEIKSMPEFSTDLLVAQEILYSLPNPVLNQIAELFENEDIFHLKPFPLFLKILSKSELRKNIFRISRLFSILLKKAGGL